MFTPGAELGVTDLKLETSELQPWSSDVGYANSGTPKTGWDRYFAGAQTVLPGLHDAYAAYQITGSGDTLFDDSRLFNGAADPQYLSQAGRLVIPTLPRQDIEAVISYVQSNSTVQDFLIRDKTLEATLAYRSALSNIWEPLPGELAVGVEAKRETSRTVFGGPDVAGNSFDVFQITLAYAQQEERHLGPHRRRSHLASQPRRGWTAATPIWCSTLSPRAAPTRPTISTWPATLSRSTRLPALFGITGFSLSNTLTGQYATAPLPLTEQIGLGGDSLVRGYTLDDGAFDTALVSRNELRAPVVSLAAAGPFANQLSPYLFVDAGYGDDRRTHKTADPVSTGLGVDCQIGPRLTASFNGAWALRSEGFTRSGDAHIGSRLTLTF